MSFPFIQHAVEGDMLTLHGLWTNTGEGELHQYDAARDEFIAI
jgi:carbonic anhydrase